MINEFIDHSSALSYCNVHVCDSSSNSGRHCHLSWCCKFLGTFKSRRILGTVELHIHHPTIPSRASFNGRNCDWSQLWKHLFMLGLSLGICSCSNRWVEHFRKRLWDRVANGRSPNHWHLISFESVSNRTVTKKINTNPSIIISWTKRLHFYLAHCSFPSPSLDA